MNRWTVIAVGSLLPASGVAFGLWRSQVQVEPAIRINAPPAKPALTHSITGKWSTCSEIAGFSGTTLILNHGECTMWFYSDFGDSSDFESPRRGKYTFDGSKVTISVSGKLFGEPHDFLETWHLDRINEKPVLLRDDALKTWQSERKLYDYGILIKTSDNPVEKAPIPFPSIRQLYSNPKAQWADPFVNGPNSPGGG